MESLQGVSSPTALGLLLSPPWFQTSVSVAICMTRARKDLYGDQSPVGLGSVDTQRRENVRPLKIPPRAVRAMGQSMGKSEAGSSKIVDRQVQTSVNTKGSSPVQFQGPRQEAKFKSSQELARGSNNHHTHTKKKIHTITWTLPGMPLGFI